MLGALGYDFVVGRDSAAMPFVIVVVMGMLFLIGRPWSFTAYLDQIIEKNRYGDARIAKKYRSQQSVLASFRQLEVAMRQQPTNVLHGTDRAPSEHRRVAEAASATGSRSSVPARAAARG